MGRCRCTARAALFERLSLEGFQAGLSWRTILDKRERYREVFHGFDVDRVAALGDADVERLMGDPGIVRNRAKIEAARKNARAAQALRDGRRAGGVRARLRPVRDAPPPHHRRGADRLARRARRCPRR